jgi:ribonuclease D
MSADAARIFLHQGDLPATVSFAGAVAIDTETTGLKPGRDRLCVVQLSAGDGTCHLVHFPPGDGDGTSPVYSAPNLVGLLLDEQVDKIFHYARFDLAVIFRYLGVMCHPVYCTKIASKLVRTYTDRHGLKDLCRELVGVELSKEQQSSDWGAPELSPEQRRYAAGDVLYLHRIRERLDQMLAREGRIDLAQACFHFLPARAQLDLKGWAEEDIFAH